MSAASIKAAADRARAAINTSKTPITKEEIQALGSEVKWVLNPDLGRYLGTCDTKELGAIKRYYARQAAAFAGLGSETDQKRLFAQDLRNPEKAREGLEAAILEVRAGLDLGRAYNAPEYSQEIVAARIARADGLTIEVPKVEKAKKPAKAKASKVYSTTHDNPSEVYTICSGDSTADRKALKDSLGITDKFCGKYAKANLFRAVAGLKGWTELPANVTEWLALNQPKAKAAKKTVARDAKKAEKKAWEATADQLAIQKRVRGWKDLTKSLEAIKAKTSKTSLSLKDIRDAFGISTKEVDCRKTSTVVKALTDAILGAGK